MECSNVLLAEGTIQNYLSTSARVIGIQIHQTSLIPDENGNVPRTRQLSARSVQDLDLRSELEPPTRDEADSHLQLLCITTLNFPERDSLQDPLVDHMPFRLEEHACRENKICRCSVPKTG